MLCKLLLDHLKYNRQFFIVIKFQQWVLRNIRSRTYHRRLSNTNSRPTQPTLANLTKLQFWLFYDYITSTRRQQDYLWECSFTVILWLAKYANWIRYKLGLGLELCMEHASANILVRVLQLNKSNILLPKLYSTWVAIVHSNFCTWLPWHRSACINVLSIFKHDH